MLVIVLSAGWVFGRTPLQKKKQLHSKKNPNKSTNSTPLQQNRSIHHSFEVVVLTTEHRRSDHVRRLVVNSIDSSDSHSSLSSPLFPPSRAPFHEPLACAQPSNTDHCCSAASYHPPSATTHRVLNHLCTELKGAYYKPLQISLGAYYKPLQISLKYFF